MKFQALLFDMDGVLIESQESHRRAFEQILQPLGILPDYQDIAGRRTDEVIRALSKKHGLKLSEADIQSLAHTKSSLAHEFIRAKPAIPEGTVETVTQLSKSFALGLASSASRRSVDFFLDHTGLRAAFRVAISGNDVQSPKPNPEIFLNASHALDVSAKHCLVIEDSVAGIQAAVSAKMSAWGVLGTVPQADLVRHGAAKVIRTVAEIPQELKV